jgi:hypothetical protein
MFHEFDDVFNRLEYQPPRHPTSFMCLMFPQGVAVASGPGSDCET